MASHETDKNRVIARLVGAVKNYYQTIVALPDSTNRIAKGAALGIAFDFLPLPIVSIPLSYLAARLLRCSPMAAVGTVVFFKLAIPFFYSLDYLTGQLLFGSIPSPDIIINGNNIITESLGRVIDYGVPFLLGGMVNAVVVYVIMYNLLKKLLNANKRKSV